MTPYILILIGIFYTSGELEGTLLQNVAINGEATQSSQNSSLGAPNNAIDGNRNPNLLSGSCIQTNEQNDPWWMVDLQSTYKIAAVIIGNSKDAENNLNGGEIWISTSKDSSSTGRFRCGIITSVPPEVTSYIPCRATEGRFVTVFLPGTRRVLSLCEVEVYSVNYAFPTPNVALKGEATQSSTLSFAAAFKAIDGRRNSFYSNGFCSHTAEGETSPWWRVDLLKTFIVTSIKVTNRGDCCAERLDGAEIRIGHSLDNNGNNNPRCATISHIRLGKTLTIHCDSGRMEGRYVNIVIPGNGKTLTLCEVEVYATPTVEPLLNVALHKTTAQVSTHEIKSVNVWVSGHSGRAVDGCRLLSYVQNCCAHTYEHTNPWWYVDLVSVHKVSAVTIYNRQDCCAETLIGAEIRVGNIKKFHDHSNPRCGIISSVVGKQSLTFQCLDMEGRYVSLVNPGHRKVVQMCEVEVYASPVANITSVPPPPAGPILPLPSVSLLLGGRNVTLVGAKLCWSDALSYCRRHHWDLLSLHSEEEQNEVEDLLSHSPVPLTDYIWVGLRRLLMKDSWFWMSGGSMTFTKWLKHPPTKLYSHPCGAMASRALYSWENQPCEQHLHFICQTANENGNQLQRIYYYSSSTKP